MGESYRRLISTPADISTADTAALAERLARNVRLQRELAAQSPHVLQFTSDLQTGEGGFYIEHEPAIAHPVPIFTPDAAVAEAEDLLRWAVALADSLRAAHTHPDRVVHGGLCPGVIVTTPEGVQKITDFGFAPSICATLGVDSFVNLRVEDRGGESGDVKETGVWQIVSPDVEHDDRICGFVDPQKYGNQTLHTFEPVSDIIGAGFLLHLMAENRHPYLHDNQDLLLPELAEAMAFFFYDGSRRKSLRNSSDERIKVWCEIVAKMLEHLPDDRPDAVTITTRLADVGVEPHSLGDAQIRELDALAVFITEEKYEDARDRVRTLAGGAATEEITEKAKSLLRSAEAGLRFAKASEVLDTADWRKAQNELDAVDRDGLPAELVEKAEAVESALKGLTEIDDHLTTLESSFGQIAAEKPTTGDEATRLHSVLDDLLTRLTKLGAEIELPAQFLGRSDTLRSELDALLGAVQRTIATIDADHSAAREWLADLQKAEKDDQRARALGLLAGREDLSIAHWPDEVIAAAEATATRIEGIAQAESWVARFATTVQDAETDHTNLEAARACLAEKPRIGEWPPRLRKELDSLARRLAEVESISADRTKAGQWLERVLQAVASEDWATANRELTSKPSLRHWTDDAIAEEARLKPLVESHLEEQERIEVWLQSAKSAGDAEDFVTALGILDSPPAAEEKIPKSAKKKIAKWRKEFEARLVEARDRALKQRTEVIREKARNLVGEIVKSGFSRFLSAESIETTVDPVEWDSEDVASAGHGDLTIHVRFEGRNEPTPSIREDLQFQVNEGLPQILNDQSLRDRLGAELRRVIHEHQTLTALRVVEPLQQGLFPEATVETSIVEMSEKTTAKISFLGPKVASTSMKTALVWDAKRADWAFADPESVAQRAVDIAAAASRELLKPKLLKTSDLLRQYGSVLRADATAPPPLSPPAIPRSLTLEGRLTIHLDDDESAPLMTFPVSCVRAGEVSIAADLGPAEAKLNEIIVARQRTAQASFIQHLEKQLTGAAVKCRLTPLVKRIKTPVEEVGFLLKPKRGDKVTVTANWNRERFLFELGEQAEAELKAVLNGSAAARDPATAKTDSAKTVTTSDGKRPAVVVGGVVLAIVAMAGAGYTFWPRSDVPPSTELTANAGVDQAIRNGSTVTLVGATANSTACEWTTDGDGSFDDATLLAAVYTPKKGDSSDRSVTLTLTCSNASGQEATDSMVVTINTAPPPDEPPSADAAIQEIRGLLSVSPYLEDALVFELVTRKDVAIVNGVATVNYRVPGLQLYERSIPLDAGDDTLSIGIDGKKLVGEARAELTALLENDPPEHFRETVGRVITEQLGPFLTTDAVSISDFVPTWKLDESHTFWVAQGETATITIKNTEPAAVSGLSFTARDGFVSLVPNGDLDEAIVSAVNGAVAAIQRNAVDDWLSGLEDLGVPPEAVEYPEIGADPRTQIQVDYSAPTLQTRKYSPEWNRDSLTFEPPDWKESAGPFARALATINALNDVDQRPAWVGQIPSIGMFHEGEGSTANELHVVTTAPGADDAEDVPVELDFRFPLDSADTDIPMPRSWPLVVRYLDLIDHPMIVGPADPAIPSSTLWTELPEELTPLVNARLAAIQLDAAFQGKPRLIDDDLPQLDTQIVLSWRRSRSYEDMSAHAVTAGLDVLTGEKALLYKLSLRLDEQGDVTMKWEGYADNEDGVSQLDAITGYDRLLREYSDRLLLEAKLARLLSSGSFAPLEPDQAVQFLIEIWNIKAPEAAPAAPQDLDSLTNTIRRQRGFSKKGRAREHDSPKPTIFGEYFCGPQSTFAIVWSTTETNSLVEGPTLVQLAATSDLIAGADVGALLLDPVFDRVPEAVEPALPKNFKDAVGIILALDAPLELLAKDPADLKLHMRNSVLRECDPIKRAASAPVPWDSLRVLREESPTKRSDFKFVRSLIPPNETWQRETDPDLIEAAFRCRAAFRAAVTAEQSPRD